MIKRFCDRCNAEIKDRGEPQYMAMNPPEYDFCDECEKDFVKFMDVKKK